jgi:glycosyltransferase involved in cell wall biosynthesis
MTGGPKHIAIYTDDPELGGVAHYNHNVLLALAAQGYRVTCIQAPSQSPLVKQQQAAGIKHEWISYDAKKDFTRSITDVVDAETVLRRVNPDLLFFSDCCPVSNVAAKHVAIQRGIPYLIVVHFAAPYLAQNFAKCLGVMAKQHAQAQALTSVSHENLDLLERRFGTPAGKGFVIYNGRPEQYFAPVAAESRAKLRAELSIPPNGVVCFSAARLTAIKGFQYIVAAATVLKGTPAWKNLYFVWAGDGEMRAEMEQQIAAHGMKDHFRVLGHRWDVCDLYGMADIFALPSQFEGMPLTVMEAMARRVPVIASAVSGIPEELGDTGYLIADPTTNVEGTVRGLAEALLAWSANPSARRTAAEKGHQRAQSLFREELMLSRITGVVGEVLKGIAEKKPQPLSHLAVPRPRGPLWELVNQRLASSTTNSHAQANGSLADRLEHVLAQNAPLKPAAVPDYQAKSPVCMLVFNRPNHTARVFEAVKKARPPYLLLVADGPRASRPADAQLCAEVRHIVTQVDWPCEVKTNFAPENLGPTARIASGLSWAFDQVDRAIILEDDCLPSPDFFRFCDEMLERYKDEPKVRCVTGNNFQFGLPRGNGSYFFTPNILIWGWATWRRAWKDYDVAMKDWPKLRGTNFLQKRLGDAKASAYWARAFDVAHAGRTAWDFPWTFSCWAKDGIGISPAVDLIENIGFDQQATGNINNVNPIFINLYAKLPVRPLDAELKPPSDSKPDLKAAAFNQRFHYEQDFTLFRRDMAAAYSAMSDDDFKRYLSRNSVAVPMSIMRSGLASLPLLEDDKPIVQRLEQALGKSTIRPQDLVAAALYAG